MNETIVLDGVAYKEQERQDFRNFRSSAEESLNETNIVQPSDMAESIRELNADILDDATKMSSIDMRSRLSMFVMNSLWSIDSLVALKALPVSALHISRQFKRLSVSIDGKGRDDVVHMVVGQREQAAKEGTMGFVDRIKNAATGFFGGGK